MRACGRAGVRYRQGNFPADGQADPTVGKPGLGVSVGVAHKGRKRGRSQLYAAGDIYMSTKQPRRRGG